MTQTKLPLISVVTVCRNAAAEIPGTIASVLSQTYPNLEYIIVDGASTDRTIEEIRRDEHRIAKWVSEPDAGIYDAMNKGARLAAGEWIIFMNAGDRFYSNDSLRRLTQKPIEDVDLIYGDHEVRYPSGSRRIRQAAHPRELWKGMVCSHQSLMCRTELMRRHPFEVADRVTADFAFMIGQQTSGKRIERRDVVVASILAGGVSDLRRVEAVRAYYRTVSRTDPSMRVKAYYLVVLLWNSAKMLIRRLMSQRAWERIAMLKHRVLRLGRSRREHIDADSAP